ncbi:hypothetical protein G6F66_015700 [Rhizopus arrhizus]|nr:hypothetical protein G6F66_015700 [Rhizopus arrhizus]
MDAAAELASAAAPDDALAAKLRARGSPPRIYALSGLARQERRDDTDSMFNGWIEKPADPDALLAILRQAH